MIELLNLCCVCLHAEHLPRFVRGFVPSRLYRISVAESCIGREYAFGHEAFQTIDAQFVPAGIENAAIGGDVSLRCVKWPVGCRERGVEKEGRSVSRGVIADELHRLHRDSIGVEEIRCHSLG